MISLSKLHNEYGCLISKTETTYGITVIRTMMYATDDLILTDDIEIEFRIPSDFVSKGGIRIFTSDTKPFLVVMCPYVHDNELVIPWLSSTKYDIAVYFHVSRDLLKRGSYIPWQTPLPLRINFPLEPVNNYNYINCTPIFGSGRLKGGRPYMEDVDILYESISISKTVNIKILGVFDGHGGKDCAERISEELPVKIAQHLKTGYKTYPEAIYKTFIEVDGDFISTGGSSGSTGTVFVWKEDVSEGFIASIGDTRAVLSRNGISVDMSIDHKAGDAEVIAFVAREGGFVNKGRINNLLAVGRAFGDSILKTPRSKDNLLQVCPDVTTYLPRKDDDFIIIATDGLWDVMSSQDAVNFVTKSLAAAGISSNADETVNEMTLDEDIQRVLHEICSNMCNNAFKILHSKDNITVTIALLTNKIKKLVPYSIPSETSRHPHPSMASGCTSTKPAVLSTQRLVTLDTDVNIDDLLKESESTVMRTNPYAKPLKKVGSSTLFRQKSNHGGEEHDSSYLPKRDFSFSGSSAVPIEVSTMGMTRQWSAGDVVVKQQTEEHHDEDDLMDFLLDDGNF